MNLINTEFKNAPFIARFLPDGEWYYEGASPDKFQYYTMINGGQMHGFITAHCICRDEDFIWESARDLIDRAVKQAAGMVRGTHIFELVSFEADKEINTFNFNELAQMIVNTTRVLKPGDQAVVRYSTVYALLKKTLDEPWGKIILKTSVDLVDNKPKVLVALLAKMLKAVEGKAYPVILLLNDMSVSSLFDLLKSEELQVLFDDFKQKQIKKEMAFSRTIHVRDRRGVQCLLTV